MHAISPACLQKFKHPDLVSSIEFHPVDDRYFVSGCFDKVLRLWDTTKDSEPLRMKEVRVFHFDYDYFNETLSIQMLLLCPGPGYDHCSCIYS